LFIAGEWTTAESGETFDAESPATGETIGTVQRGGREDARRAIAAANEAAPGWARLSAFDRAAALHRVADVV
jgi:succinate-semialdehyde dehydrogenase/glutarate-semialdehyde dehydrogenase